MKSTCLASAIAAIAAFTAFGDVVVDDQLPAGNIIFEKGYYKITPRKNPSDLSLFSITSPTQNVSLSNVMRLIDGYMICERPSELPSFEGVEVLEKEGDAPTLDFLLQKGKESSDAKACCVYALLLPGKDAFIEGWKTGVWGRECGDEVELLYRTTLQKFLCKTMSMDSLFYEPTNTVYFKNVVVYRAGVSEGFAMYGEMEKINVVLGLMPEKAEDVKMAWKNVIGTAVSFGAKRVVVGGRKENVGIVRDALFSK